MNVRVLENKLQGPSLFSVPTLQAALSDLPQNEAASALLEIAENAEQKRRNVLKRSFVIGVLWMVLFLALRFVQIFYPVAFTVWGHLSEAVLLLSILFLRRLFSTQKYVQTEQNAVAALLLCPHESRFLPSLVDGLHTHKTPEWQNLLYPALTTALWDAPNDDIALRLDGPRRAALRALVAYPYAVLAQRKQRMSVPSQFDDATTDLTIAALKALVSVGDRKTVKVLHRIIKTECAERNEEVVHDAAHEFLPILQKRIEGNEKIYEYLRTLAGKPHRASYAAISEYMDTFAPQDVRPVLTGFLAEQNRRAVRSRWLSGFGLLAVFAALALACSSLIRYPSWIGVAIVVFAPLISRCIRMLWRPVSDAEAGRIAYELAKRSGDDTRVLPVLLHALQTIVDKKQSEGVQKAVLHLLPLLRAGDAALVPPYLRHPVRAWLTMPRGALGRARKNRAVVALNALATIGATDALSRVCAVERYAGKAKHGDTLRQTAARCADALRARKPLA